MMCTGACYENASQRNSLRSVCRCHKGTRGLRACAPKAELGGQCAIEVDRKGGAGEERIGRRQYKSRVSYFLSFMGQSEATKLHMILKTKPTEIKVKSGFTVDS